MKEERAENTTENQSSISQSIAYALPKFPCFLLIGGPTAVMAGIYVKYFGLSLAAIALAQMLSRLFDGITDPILGYVSDRSQQRYGTRKPLIVVGCLSMLLTGTMLFIPYGWDPLQPEPVHFTYLLFFFLAFTLSWTVMDIPHLAWGADISSDPKGRSQRFSIRSMMTYTAPLIFFSIPLLPIFDTTEVTPETLKYAVYLAWVLMPLCLWISMRHVPNPPRYSAEKSTSVAFGEEEVQTLSKKQRFQKAARVIIGNRPLLVFYLAYALVGFGYSMSGGLTFFYVDNYLGLAEKMPFVFMVQYGIGASTVWFWGLAARKFGARPVWALGISLCALGLLGVGFIQPGEANFWPYLLYKAVIGAGFISTFVAGFMLMSNISDYGKWKFGQECSASYFAWTSTFYKFNAAVGVAIGLLLAEWMGFDAKADVMSEAAVMALRLSYIGLPVILLFLATIVISRIPLSTHQQSVVSKRLAAKELRASHQTS